MNSLLVCPRSTLTRCITLISYHASVSYCIFEGGSGDLGFGSGAPASSSLGFDAPSGYPAQSGYGMQPPASTGYPPQAPAGPGYPAQPPSTGFGPPGMNIINLNIIRPALPKH